MLINRGRTEPCRDTFGGIRAIYLWSWVQVPFYDIKGVRGSILLKYPPTTVYTFRVSSGDYNESLTENNAYTQNLSVKFPKITSIDNFDFDRYQDLSIGVIVEDRNGLFRLMGAENGCTISNLNVSLGGAYADFNGYALTIEAQERFSSPLFNDIRTVGFPLNETNYLLSESFEILAAENGDLLTYI